MTNETANAVCGTADCVVDKLSEELTQGQELCAEVSAWLMEKGMSFAIDLAVAVLIVIVGAVAVKLIRGGVARALAKSKKISQLLTDFIVSVVGKICWAAIILVALQRLGVNVGPLVAGLGVTGFVLGFAFQESLGSLAAGMMIALNQPFKVGDYVTAGGIEGSVTELNMMAIELATADNKKVVIPNKAVWGSAITNFSALGKRRVDTKIAIAYGADIKKALEVAEAALRNLPGVLADPAPAVSVASLDDSAVTLNLFPWAACADYWAVRSGAQSAVKKAFEENSIEIPFPQLDVRVVQAQA